jgi:hypothetical protein
VKNEKTYYDIELKVDIGNWKKGSRIRGECLNKNDFGKFKRWWLALNKVEWLCEADQCGKIRTLFNYVFEDVVITKKYDE